MPPPFDARPGLAGFAASSVSTATAQTCRCASCGARTQCVPGSVERDVLVKIASACGLDGDAVDAALGDVRTALAKA